MVSGSLNPLNPLNSLNLLNRPNFIFIALIVIATRKQTMQASPE
jgi:hypothetical protein